MSNLYWLSEAQMERLRPYFPKARGRARVDDRRVLSGIIFINRNGLRWCDAPAEYGPPKTLYNRWKRWSDMGVFARILMGLAEQAPDNKTISIDATYLKAHRTASTRFIRQAEVGSVRTMLDRVKDKFDLDPERIIADTAYGSGPMLGWLVDRKIAPHIPVIDKASRTDGTWCREDFEWDPEGDQYTCPEGQSLKQSRRNYSGPSRGPTTTGRTKYRGLKLICQACPSKAKCCPNADARAITREEHEDARQVARDISKTKQYAVSMRLRKKVEMFFAHLKRILGLGRLRLRGPCGANDEFLLAATAQNLRKLAKILPAPQQMRKA